MTVLDTIFAFKREEVARAKVVVSERDLRAMIGDAAPPRGFARALSNRPDLALIAEVKKASPSKGVIRANFDPVAVAHAYASAGAHALSVLTDERWFQGSSAFLRGVRAAMDLPILRKDFIYDPYQILEARAWGADAVLLIASHLTSPELRGLIGFAQELGLDCLVEVHDEREAGVALGVGASLIGVNNRNLKDLSTDLAISERVIPLLMQSPVRVSESALDSRADLDRVQAAGANAVLIGTVFCAAPDIEAKVREVMGWTA